MRGADLERQSGSTGGGRGADAVLRASVERACRCSPCALVLEDIDEIATSESLAQLPASPPVDYLLVDALLDALALLAPSAARGVALIATAVRGRQPRVLQRAPHGRVARGRSHPPPAPHAVTSHVELAISPDLEGASRTQVRTRDVHSAVLSRFDAALELRAPTASRRKAILLRSSTRSPAILHGRSYFPHPISLRLAILPARPSLYPTGSLLLVILPACSYVYPTSAGSRLSPAPPSAPCSSAWLAPVGW